MKSVKSILSRIFGIIFYIIAILFSVINIWFGGKWLMGFYHTAPYLVAAGIIALVCVAIDFAIKLYERNNRRVAYAKKSKKLDISNIEKSNADSTENSNSDEYDTTSDEGFEATYEDVTETGEKEECIENVGDLLRKYGEEHYKVIDPEGYHNYTPEQYEAKMKLFADEYEQAINERNKEKTESIKREILKLQSYEEMIKTNNDFSAEKALLAEMRSKFPSETAK